MVTKKIQYITFALVFTLSILLNPVSIFAQEVDNVSMGWSFLEIVIHRPLSVLPNFWGAGWVRILIWFVACAIAAYLVAITSGWIPKEGYYHKKANTLSERILEACGLPVALGFFIYSIVAAVNSDFGIIMSSLYWIILLFAVFLISFLMYLFILIVPLTFAILFVEIVVNLIVTTMIALDKRKYARYYSPANINAFIQNKKSYPIKDLLDAYITYPDGLDGERRKAHRQKVAFVLKNLLAEHHRFIDVDAGSRRGLKKFINKNGNKEDTTDYTKGICMPNSVFEDIKDKVCTFLLSSGAHDLIFIVEKTIGFEEHAYFSPMILDELTTSGVILKLDIGTNPEAVDNVKEPKFIYSHRESSKPMKSVEIEID